MSVKLIGYLGYGGYPSGSIVEFPASTEAALIGSGQAIASTGPVTAGPMTTTAHQGSVTFAAGASSLVVTNADIAAQSLVHAYIAQAAADAAALRVERVVASAGFFTIFLNAAATAAVSVKWALLNYQGPLPFVAGSAASALLPVNSRLVYEGDSITNSAAVPSHVFGEYTATGVRYYYPSDYNQATAGETIAQMLTQVALVNAQKPDVVTILAGTNDLALGSDTPAQIYANLMAILDSYFANGAKKCVICTVMKRTDAAYNALSAGRKADFDIYNALVRATARANVLVADLDVFTPPGDALDGLHPNWSGQFKIAAVIGGVLNSLIEPVDMSTLYLDASNLLLTTKNPQLTGIGGTKSGTVPPTGDVADTWTVNSGTTSITCACSKTTLNGAEAQRIDFGGTSAAGNEVVFSNIAPVPAIANKVYEVFVDFMIPAGSALIRAPSISIANVAVTANRNQTANLSTEAISGTLRCPGYLKTSATGTLGFSISVKFSAGTPVGAVIWAKPVLREVLGFNAANP